MDIQIFPEIKGASRPISRVLCCLILAQRSFICDVCHHTPVATYPETRADHTPRERSFPYLVLLQMGFTMPSAFTNAVRSYRTFSPLPTDSRRYLFCGTFRRLTSPRCYLASCPMEPGLSSTALRQNSSDHPADLLSTILLFIFVFFKDNFTRKRESPFINHISLEISHSTYHFNGGFNIYLF